MREAIAGRPVASFVALTYGFSWSVVVAASVLTDSTGPQFLAVVVSAFGPAVAGAVVTLATGPGLRRWIAGMARLRIDPRWYLVAVGIPVGFAVVETGVAAVLGVPLDPATLGRRLPFWAGTFLLALVLTGGNEEPGWRGVLQPRLQREYGLVPAAVLVGVAWLVWHLPADVLLSALGGGLDPSPSRLLLRLATVPFAVFLAWLYDATDGSILPVMITHAGWNTTSVLVPVSGFQAGTPGVGEGTGLALTATRVGLVALVALAVLVGHDRRRSGPTAGRGDATHDGPETPD